MNDERWYRPCATCGGSGVVSEYEQGPNARHTALCPVPSCVRGFVPVDSPCLPAVAAWLSEHPEARDYFRAMVTYDAYPTPAMFECLRSLVAALTPVEGER